VRIGDADGDDDGEILVRGPNVMMGYFDDPAATAEVLREGWFHTGDLGRLGRDGRLRITGRLKNMIATAAGKKIYPEEVEGVMAGSPYILEIVVAGGRDARGEREEVQAHVFPDRDRIAALARGSGRAFDEALVEEVIRREIETRGEQLAPYKRVKRVIVRAEPFPKTTTGKIRRQGDASGHPSATSRD
jgi:long-chain acyl-CoA synthetase